jgi:hypothetical protein
VVDDTVLLIGRVDSVSREVEGSVGVLRKVDVDSTEVDGLVVEGVDETPPEIDEGVDVDRDSAIEEAPAILEVDSEDVRVRVLGADVDVDSVMDEVPALMEVAGGWRVHGFQRLKKCPG